MLEKEAQFKPDSFCTPQRIRQQCNIVIFHLSEDKHKINVKSCQTERNQGQLNDDCYIVVIEYSNQLEVVVVASALDDM